MAKHKSRMAGTRGLANIRGMKKHSIFSLLLLCGTLGATVAPAPAASAATSPQAVANGLISADRNFAAAAASVPAAKGVAAMLDDDVALFIAPLPPLARGKAEAVKLIAKAFGDDPAPLLWAPVRAGVSADGMQGFTYGFATRAVAGKPPILSKYVSYWIKRPNGWRVAAFKLVPRAEGAVVTTVRPPALPKRIVKVDRNVAKIRAYRADLDRTERQFSADSQVTSLGAGFRKYGSADAMNVGGGADFTYGNDAIAELQGGDKGGPSTLRWTPDGVLVSSSGDLGITYGYLLRNGPTPPGRLARIPWITVWRRNSPSDPWRYVAE